MRSEFNTLDLSDTIADLRSEVRHISQPIAVLKRLAAHRKMRSIERIEWRAVIDTFAWMPPFRVGESSDSPDSPWA